MLYDTNSSGSNDSERPIATERQVAVVIVSLSTSFWSRRLKNAHPGTRIDIYTLDVNVHIDICAHSRQKTHVVIDTYRPQTLKRVRGDEQRALSAIPRIWKRLPGVVTRRCSPFG